MATNLTEEELKVKYAALSDFEIKKELQAIFSIPNARTNIDALTRLSVLMPEMEKRGIEMPKSRSSASNNSRQNYQDEEGGFNAGTAIFGVILIVGGIALSTSSGSIYYGAILVGIATLVKSFI